MPDMNDARADVLRALRECFSAERAERLMNEFAAGARVEIACRLYTLLASSYLAPTQRSNPVLSGLDLHQVETAARSLAKVAFVLADAFMAER